MGLDMNIYRKPILSDREKLLNELDGTKEVWRDVIYWRKFWELQEVIGDIVGENIENCEKYKLNKENILDIINWLELSEYNKEIDEEHRANFGDYIENLTKLIEETDFTKYELYYTGWW